MHFLPLTWPDLRRICKIEDEVQVPANCGTSQWVGRGNTFKHNNITRTGAKGTSLKNVNWKLCPRRCVTLFGSWFWANQKCRLPKPKQQISHCVAKWGG